MFPVEIYWSPLSQDQIWLALESQYESSGIQIIGLQLGREHKAHLELSMFKLDRALPFGLNFTAIAHPNTRTIKRLQGVEWFSGCNHMIGSSRITEEGMCYWAASLQCMACLFMFFSFFSMVILPCASRYNNVMFLQKKSHFINCSSHTRAFWTKAPSTVRTKDLSFFILLAFLQTWRIIWLLFLHKRLILFLSFIILYLRSSSN